MVDEESLKKYKKVTGDFKQRIKNGVDFKEGVFYQNPGKRCAFLNEQNLCDMYIALGEESFCETCQRYPRHIEEFENVREFTLSASCPEAVASQAFMMRSLGFRIGLGAGDDGKMYLLPSFDAITRILVEETSAPL